MKALKEARRARTVQEVGWSLFVIGDVWPGCACARNHHAFAPNSTLAKAFSERAGTGHYGGKRAGSG